MRLAGIRVAIVTASDRVSRREAEDRSGDLIEQTVRDEGGDVVAREVHPDDRSRVADALRRLCDSGCDLVLTTGGSGLAPRDVTPEATLDVIEREVRGIPEAARIGTLGKTPLAMLSRAVAGSRGRALIVNLPGSPKAVVEWLEILLPAFRHAVEVLRGEAFEFGAPHRPA